MKYVHIDLKELEAKKNYPSVCCLLSIPIIFCILAYLFGIIVLFFDRVGIFSMFLNLFASIVVILFLISVLSFFPAIFFAISAFFTHEISYCESCDEAFDFDVTVCPLCGNELEHESEADIKLIRGEIIGNGQTFIRHITRDENGEIVIGHGELAIENGTDLNAIAILIACGTNEILHAVYIQYHSSYTVRRIKDGEYTLYFTLGRHWDDESKKFLKNRTYQRFEDPIEFYSSRHGESIQYSIMSVSLHGVAEGRARTEFLSEDEFPTW